MRWLITRLYAFLVKLYPPQFKHQFEAELNTVFVETLVNVQGWQAVLRVFLRELRDFPLALVRAHRQEGSVLTQRIAEAGSFVRVLAIFFLVPAVLACLCNFARWNYVFAPPALSSVTDEFSSVASIGYFSLGETGAMNGDTDFGAYGYLTDTDFGRVPRWADAHGLGQISTLDASTLRDIPQMIERAGWDLDWMTDQPPSGYVVRGEDASGLPLVLVSLVLIDGDHYRYHEGVFRSGLLMDANRYNYDNAGIEFAQWGFWFVGALFLWGVVILVVMVFDRDQRLLKI